MVLSRAAIAAMALVLTTLILTFNLSCSSHKSLPSTVEKNVFFIVHKFITNGHLRQLQMNLISVQVKHSMEILIFFIIAILCIGVQSGNLNEGGSINDLFVNDDDGDYESMQYAEVKKAMQLDPDFVRSLFNVVEEKLQIRLDELSNYGNSIIPIVSMKTIEENGHRLPDDVAAKVKKHGVLVVRNTILKEEVQQLMDDLRDYLLINNIDTTTYNETVYEIYWSQSQLKARQHPNMFKVQDALLKLWTLRVPNPNCTQISPAMYIDRLRIRKPGDTSFTLPFHIDGGGIERWSDPIYRKVYEQIFRGSLDEYDPFVMDYRIQAAMNGEGYANGCTFFRAFQGWLATSPTGPGQGTLKVLPILKEATWYWMLRPFLEDVPEQVMPGCQPGKTFHVSERWHPKLQGLVSLPNIEMGDSVWWHADLIHSVESEHKGQVPSSVFYIPTGPKCGVNLDYLAKMRRKFLSGETPPDFPLNNNEVKFVNRASVKDLSELGKSMMGFSENMGRSHTNDEL